ncbi:unnamed protein product [Vitrella brassicaformis CCMP3155]|uniref:Cationic amino acid transporter C-terminal domain-containing protein n=2 Tax=Vitrella brassicaformis TaxID=1169539 RepID=A0A0G4EC93_VITBC|nr:unnamed protein product [Vitrella brassicaformis CCMP3155]|eukprot:CEL93550.1 unnamed protein product [Vitrella brassicaformis CCMP3155]
MFLLERAARRKDSRTIRSELALDTEESLGLRRCLSPRDLVAYGVSCTVGAGIYLTAGTAGKQHAGPALFISFIIGGVACLMNALCYCEFASRIPAAGSAYSYAYNTLGECSAFIMGWILFLEYGVSAAVTSRGVSAYIEAFFHACGLPLPPLLTDYTPPGPAGYFFSFSLIAPLTNLICTLICAWGAEESVTFTKVATIVNVGLIGLFVVAGSFFFDPKNFVPFAPFGVNGVVQGGSLAVFCFIGFDAVSCLAEEVQKPQRDIPRALLGTLASVTVMYALCGLVLSGMVPLAEMSESAALAMAFEYHHAHWLYFLVSLGAVTTSFCTTLTCLMGQPRIFYRMALDGLWLRVFADVNPRTLLPAKGIWITGAVVILLSACINFTFLINLISAGTLLSYAVVCAGILLVRYIPSQPPILPPIPEEADTATEQQVTEASFTNLNLTTSLTTTITIPPPPSLPSPPFVASLIGSFFLLALLAGYSLAYQWPLAVTVVIWVLLLLVVAAFVVVERRFLKWRGANELPSVSHRSGAPGGGRSDVSPGRAAAAPAAATAVGVGGAGLTTKAARMRRSFSMQECFECPGVPVVPLVGIVIDVYLIATMRLPMLLDLATYLLIGCGFYFLYGAFHSSLNTPLSTTLPSLNTTDAPSPDNNNSSVVDNVRGGDAGGGGSPLAATSPSIDNQKGVPLLAGASS